jgi:glucose-6-phosphate 1-dehydrogenase
VVAGKPVPAYRVEPYVAPDSDTETFVAMKLLIDSWRWADVPFYLRTGKRLPRRVTEIAIQFKRAPFMLFRQTATEHLAPNLLIIRIQPDEGISLRFDAKVPGPAVRVGTVDMEFQYAKYFGNAPSTGYETLLHDCLVGDATLFQRADNVEAGWGVVEPILEVWKGLPPKGVPLYQAGSWGPSEADDLLAREGRHWRNPA